MKVLKDRSPRIMLQMRMEVFAFSAVPQGKYREADQVAEAILDHFDSLMRERPTDSAGFWATEMYTMFVYNCSERGWHLPKG